MRFGHYRSAEHGHYTRSDGVGHIPERHLGSEFLGRYPIHQQPVARAEAGSLEKIVKDDEHCGYADERAHEVGAAGAAADPSADRGAPAEDGIEHHAGSQRNHQMPARIGSVGDETIGKLAESIDQSAQSQDKAEACILDAEFRTQHGHSERKVLTHEIKHRITDHRADDHPPLPIIETLFCLHLLSSLNQTNIIILFLSISPH